MHSKAFEFSLLTTTRRFAAQPLQGSRGQVS
jgi:hypothetical protein